MIINRWICRRLISYFLYKRLLLLYEKDIEENDMFEEENPRIIDSAKYKNLSHSI